MENISELPRHVGLITDGNRRWAKEHNLPKLEGHRKATQTVKKIAQAARKKGIKIFTAWGFSTENWDRPKEEVNYLMDLFEKSIDNYAKSMKDEDIRIRVVGQKWRFSPAFQEKIEKIEKNTGKNEGMIFNIALSYGGRDEIIQGFKNIAKNSIDLENIDEKTVSDNLWLPDVDLIIRTGGEQRLSGFMAWQSTYAELFFIKKYLPDFTPEDFDNILSEYAQRQRRFGK